MNIDVNNSGQNVDICITVTHCSSCGLSEATLLHINSSLGATAVVDTRLIPSSDEEKDSAVLPSQSAFSHVIDESLLVVIEQVKLLRVMDVTFSFSGRTDDTGASFCFRFPAKTVGPSGFIQEPQSPPPPTSRDIIGTLLLLFYLS